MTPANKLLSDITIFTKYAKYLPELQRRETWEELVTRNMDMHIRKYPTIEDEIRENYEYVYAKKVLPSMRSLQFGGRPIELAHNRIYNCGYLPLDDIDGFSELMFLLLGGTGIGYSVQHRHIDKLPIVGGTLDESRRFLVGDSIEGWADAIKVLVEAHFLSKQQPIFDVRDIRPKGAALVTTGGRAPGPEPLRVCLNDIETLLINNRGKALQPIDVHDICCIIADAVLTGGIRRAAMISLFDRTDTDMLTCKSGEWWVDNPQRGRANNSAVLPRHEVTKEEFMQLMKTIKDSGSGEPGTYWTSDLDWGTNPCCEIALEPFQFCNLCEVNVSDVDSSLELNSRVGAAAFIGTLQAGYTDFHYLRPIWKRTTEKAALIGVGMTGIGSGKILQCDLISAAVEVNLVNKCVAQLIGINPAERTTTVKPSGTSSLVCGSSSGIHAWHNDYYIRRMILGKNEALYKYLLHKVPALIEDSKTKSNEALLSFPQEAPEGSILRTEPMLDLLDRVKTLNMDWVGWGHLKGVNVNNVSCTVSVREDSWDIVAEWMWHNRSVYNGIALLPYDGGTYIQAPFEDITKEQFLKLSSHILNINLLEIQEDTNNTDLAGEVACSGGLCEI